DRHVDLGVDVVALADEPRIGLDPHPYVHVAGAAARLACVPLAGEPDALPVVDARRDLHLALAAVDDQAGAGARVAWMLDDDAPAGALGAGLRAHKLPEHAARHVLQASGPFAPEAPDWGRARLDAVSPARRAGDGDLERDGDGHAACRLGEVDL